MQCIGIKTNGIRCNVMCLEGTRCKIHLASIHNYGPNETRKRELKFIHSKNKKDIQHNYFTHQIIPQLQAEIRLEDIRYQTALHELETLITQETQELGYNADRDAIQRREDLIRRNRQRREQNRLERLVAFDRVRQQVDELGAFAADNQNVHTTLIVQKVKAMVKKILEIPVPDEYLTDTLKTPGEIILQCNLTKKAAQQMMSKYCEEVDIYDLGIGIYPCVLNSVWQYIKNSEHTEDLKKILASEMQDNIGMCQQGNLSRLCNILSGYLDGLIVDTKSPREILGERLSQISQTNLNPVEMFLQARQALEELEIPQDEWDEWLTTLLDT
jgi:hypothetical protein